MGKKKANRKIKRQITEKPQMHFASNVVERNDINLECSIFQLKSCHVSVYCGAKAVWALRNEFTRWRKNGGVRFNYYSRIKQCSEWRKGHSLETVNARCDQKIWYKRVVSDFVIIKFSKMGNACEHRYYKRFSTITMPRAFCRKCLKRV